LRVHDNGSGFDPSSPAASAGLGFLDMRERLSQIGGFLSLESSPAQGTEVIARLPFVPAKFSATPG
jgi:signal transduction histidine kinase